MTGLSRRLKELNPKIKCIGVDPAGSVLAGPAHHKKGEKWVVEGTGKDFMPRVWDINSVDRFVEGPDKDSFLMARRLLKEEGLMVGGSSG